MTETDLFPIRLKKIKTQNQFQPLFPPDHRRRLADLTTEAGSCRHGGTQRNLGGRRDDSESHLVPVIARFGSPLTAVGAGGSVSSCGLGAGPGALFEQGRDRIIRSVARMAAEFLMNGLECNV